MESYKQRESFLLMQDGLENHSTSRTDLCEFMKKALSAYGREIGEAFSYDGGITTDYLNNVSKKDRVGHDEILIPILLNLADLLTKLKHIHDAVRLLRVLECAYPDNAHVNYFMGLLFYSVKQYLDAVPYLKTAVACQQKSHTLTNKQYNHLQTIRLKCAERIRIKRPPGRILSYVIPAVDTDVQSAESKQGRFNSHISTAKHNLRHSKHEEALKNLKLALELFPDDLTALEMAGQACTTLKRNEEALEYYRRHVEISPDSVIYYDMGNLLYDLRRTDEAVTILTRAVEIDPCFTTTIALLQHLLYITRNPHRSLGVFDALIAASPDNIMGYCGRGLALLRMANNYLRWMVHHPDLHDVIFVTEYDILDGDYHQMLSQMRWSVNNKDLSIGGMKKEITKCYVKALSLKKGLNDDERALFNIFEDKINGRGLPSW